MLEAFDLTGSLRDAGELAGCSHHTVAHYVAARDAGGLCDRPVARPQLIDEFLPKVEEWMEHSKGKIRADKAHDKLVALGYLGSERTTRRAVVKVRRAYRAGRVRVHRGVGERAGDVDGSTTSGTARSSTGPRPPCSARGWPGAGSGWCSRSWTRPRRACSPRWMSRCAAWVGHRPMC